MGKLSGMTFLKLETLCLLMGLSLLIGCNAQLADYVREAAPTPIAGGGDLPSTANRVSSVTITPGSVYAEGSTIATKVVVGIHRQTVANSELESRVSINQFYPQ